MNNGFDSVIRGIKVDAANWHQLGQIKPNDKFEVDFYGKRPKIYAGESTGPSLMKKIKNAAKSALTYNPTDEEAARGIVRISHSGMIGGLERTINRTYFASAATAEDTIKWLDEFIDKTIVDMEVLRGNFELLIAGGLDERAQAGKELNKMELFQTILSLRNEVASSKNLIENLKVTYSGKQPIIDKLDSIDEKMKGDDGLVNRLNTVFMALINHVDVDALTQTNSTAVSFEKISEGTPLDVVVLNDRAEIKNGWKSVLQKPSSLTVIPGSQDLKAPSTLVADLSRSFGYQLNGITYASIEKSNEKDDYQGFYLNMCNLIGDEAAKRVGTLLNQTMLADTPFLQLTINANTSFGQTFKTFGLTVEEGIVTLEASLTGVLSPLDNPLEQRDTFYKVKATFPLEELQAADFNDKEDPLPTMRVTEVIDISNCSEATKAFLEKMQQNLNQPEGQSGS